MKSDICSGKKKYLQNLSINPGKWLDTTCLWLSQIIIGGTGTKNKQFTYLLLYSIEWYQDMSGSRAFSHCHQQWVLLWYRPGNFSNHHKVNNSVFKLKVEGQWGLFLECEITIKTLELWVDWLLKTRELASYYQIALIRTDYQPGQLEAPWSD